MKLLRLYTLLFFFIQSIQADKLSEKFPVDFYKAMQDNNKFFDESHIKHDPTWQLIHELFDKTMSHEYSLDNQPRIPYVFHLIWLGGKVPQRYYTLKKQLEELHPGCIVKLWTDREAAIYNMKNRYAYEKTGNFGEKSDIWRYEILYDEGGVYLDGDFNILQPLTDLFYSCDFFVGTVQWSELSLANGFLGACPHHPILKVCIDTIQPVETDLSCESVMGRTGPYFLTRCFLSAAREQNLFNIALPPSFFYPWPHYIDFENNPEKIKALIKPYSLAIHMYARSWQWWSENFRK